MAAIVLDQEALEHARAIVARESPTSQQEARFQLTGALFAITILVSGVWIIAALRGFRYQFVFIDIASLTSLAAVSLLPFNAGFAYRLVRTHASARRLGLSWRRRWNLQDWAWLMLLAFVHVFGYPIFALGAFGLVEEWHQRDFRDLMWRALPVFVLGFGFIVLPPMELARRRVGWITALRGPLQSKETGAEEAVEVPVTVYDQITSLEFEQVSADSHRSLQRVPPPEADQLVAIRLSPEFQRSMEALTEAQTDPIYDFIGELGTRCVDPGDPGTETATLAVPETRFRVRVHRRIGSTEINIVSLEIPPDVASS